MDFLKAIHNAIHKTTPFHSSGRVLVYSKKLTTLKKWKINFEILQNTVNLKAIYLKLSSNMKIENNRLTQQLFKDKVIGKATENTIRATASGPGIMCSLPKVPKAGTPLRPFLWTKATYNYGMSQLLVNLLTPIKDSQFTVNF